MQAARGASLSDASAAQDEVTRSRGRLWLLFAVVGGCLYGLDQGSKALAVARLGGDPDHRVIGDLLVFHLTRNAGAAFSTGTRYTTLISIVAVVAVLVVIYLMRRIGDAVWALAMALLFAGVGGNLTDRLVRGPGPLRGHVVDFVMLPHWPVFNIADVCINLAALTILIQAFRGIRLDGSHVIPRGRRGLQEPVEPSSASGQDDLG